MSAPAGETLAGLAGEQDAHAPPSEETQALAAPSVLGQTWVLFVRELRGFFLAPVSYLVWLLLLAAAGWLFAASVQNGAEASLGPLFASLGVLLVFAAPLLTMRLVAEEHRLGTLEVLLTDPAHEAAIVLGKYFAALAFLVVVLAPTLAFPLILSLVGQPDPGPIAAGYLGLVLLGALFLAIGLLASALLDSQVAAASASFSVLFLLWLLGRVVAGLSPGPLRDVLAYVSVLERFAPFHRGVVDTRTLVFCASLAVLALFWATRALALRRLR